MSLRGAIYDLLNDIEADVYPLVAPQETTDPYVSYSVRIEPIRVQGAIAVNEVTLTCDIFANTRDQCLTLAALIYTGMEGASGTYDSETLHICNWVSEDEGYISELQKFNITQVYVLKFT
jgi:hypothetical protein